MNGQDLALLPGGEDKAKMNVPGGHLLMRKAEGGNATVTVCHTGTRDLAFHTRQAV